MHSHDAAPTEREMKLVEFTRSVIKTRCWGFEEEEDGGTIQDLAEKLGLIVPIVATPESLETYRFYDCEIGDVFYVFADWLEPIGKRRQP